MKIKKTITLLFMFSIFSIISACSNSNSDSEQNEEHVIKLAHVTQEDTAYAEGVEKFAELVEEKTEGEVTVEIFPNGELGSNPELVEQLQHGTIGGMIPSVAILSAFTDKTLMLDLPYLFENKEAAEHILDGEIGDEILEDVEDDGIIGIGWFDQGWRNIHTNKKVEKPEDMKGLKFRILETPVHVDFMNAFGASGTNIDFTELFTALDQGVVDGAEQPYANILLNGYAEVTPYITETEHIYDALPMIFSELVWEELSENQQEKVLEAADEASDYERELVTETDEEIKEDFMEDDDVEVIELTEEERDEFSEIVKEELYDKWDSEIGDDLLERTLEKQEEFLDN